MKLESYRKIPYSGEQGIFSQEQGISSGKQGKFIQDQGAQHGLHAMGNKMLVGADIWGDTGDGTGLTRFAVDEAGDGAFILNH